MAAAYPMILEPESSHPVGIIEIAAVQQQWPANQLPHSLEIGVSVEQPLRHDGERVDPMRCAVGICRVHDPVTKDHAGRVGGLGVVSLYPRPGSQEAFNQR